MGVKFSPFGNNQFVDSTGAPASGWKIYTYVAGSSTLATTYTTSAGSVAQSNPIVLNSLGFPTTGQIWLTEGVSYKLVLTNASDVVQKTEDNLSGTNDVSVSQDQWVSGPAPTYISATSFSVVGDQTSTFQVGRRVKTTNSGGTIYSRISASAYGALTTVTVVNDSGTLDSGLSAVSYGLLSATNPSIPKYAAVVSTLDASGIITGSTTIISSAGASLSGLVEAYSATGQNAILIANATAGTVYGVPTLETGVGSRSNHALNIVHNSIAMARFSTGTIALTGSTTNTGLFTGTSTIISSVGAAQIGQVEAYSSTGQDAVLVANASVSTSSGVPTLETGVGSKSNHPFNIVFNSTAMGRFTASTIVWTGNTTITGTLLTSNTATLGGAVAASYGGVNTTHSSLTSATAWSHSFVNSHGTVPYGVAIKFSGAAPNGTGNYFFYAEDSTTFRGGLRSNGGLENYSANNVNLCSVEAKGDFAPFERDWLKVLAVRKSIEYWKYLDATNKDDDSSWCCSPMSEDIEKIYPEYVVPFGESGKKGLRDHPLTWEMIANLIDEIEALKQKVGS